MLTRHVLVTGMVQGVGYRAWTREAVLQRNLVGWVRNLHDGRVEAVIHRTMTPCWIGCQGPGMAKVEDIGSRDEEALATNYFEVAG